MKKFLILGALALSAKGYADGSLFRGFSGPVLDCTIIKIIDGLSIGIDGERVKMMIKVRKAVRRMQLGEPDASGALVGIFEFDGKRYSASQLAQLEAELRNNGDAATLEQMKPLLKEVKNGFMAKIKPFMANARGAKGQMLKLIEESCRKRKRHDSILLRWGAAREEEEARQFERDVVDFKTFDIFCTDLVHFIEDVIRSCPKALAQYKQMVIQKKRDKGR